jgi:hypothetical protein
MTRSRGTARARESEGERRARVKRAGRAAAAGAVVLLRERAKKKAAVETGGAPKALLSKAASSLFFSAMATELRRRPSAPEPERARSAGLAPRVAATRASNWWLRYEGPAPSDLFPKKFERRLKNHLLVEWFLVCFCLVLSN